MSYTRVVTAFILVNAAGITLRYFELDTYFIFLGFRFHLGCILPFVLMLNQESLSDLRESLKNPPFRKKLIPLFWILFSLAFVLIFFYLAKYIKPGDPDYFYEFGLSSIFDFPLYLVWNIPQLFMLFMTLSFFADSNLAYLKVFAAIVLLFGFEFIPFNSDFAPFSAASFILMALTASFFVTRLQNIYWFSFIIFSSVWSIILLTGSSSEIIINIFFAREYSSWDGFFEAAKQYSGYMVPSFLFILLVITSSYGIFSAGKTT